MAELIGTGEAAGAANEAKPGAWRARAAAFGDWSWPVLLGLFLMALGFVLISLLIALWPVVIEATGSASTQPRTVTWFGYEYSLTADAALLLLVVLVSALGSFVHAATSFVDYTGNRKLRRSWVWWYILRVFVGSGLALLFYFAIRGGFFAADTPSEQINPYGIAAIAGLVGLFSKQATDKLREIFDTAFHVREGYGDDARKDSITNPQPALVGSTPPQLVAGGDVALELDGSGFVPESVVQVRRLDNGSAEAEGRTVTYVGPSKLRVTLDPRDIGSEGSLEMTVMNPEPGGGVSRSLVLSIAGAAVPPAA